jgi:tetratricopeptide (TPR) repeat protein
MNEAVHKPLSQKPLLVLGILVSLAIIGFIGVGRLVSLYRARQKALAATIYRQGLADQHLGRLNMAIEDFRAALIYDPDNDQLQLSMGRALRDNGNLDEAEDYLETLWERAPQDSTINLALGRLAARRGDIQEALRYYHSAIYGVWRSDADANRLQARFELTEFLLQKNAFPEAQAELISLLPTLPPDPAMQIRVARLLAQAQDYSRALAEYQVVLKENPANNLALTGAGEAAFQLGRYRTAQKYLQASVNSAAADPTLASMLDTTNLILSSDPFHRGISDAERNRRIQAAYIRAGARLDECGRLRGVDLNGLPSSSTLAALQAQYSTMKPLVNQMGRSAESDLPDTLMDLVFQIELETQKECGNAQGMDLALLLIARDRDGVDR